jgi:hypothetical protein
MEYAIVFIGILAIGCTCVLFMTINVHSSKISDVQKAVARLHFKVLNVESDVNIVKKQRVHHVRTKYSEPRVKREVVYKIPKKITGDLTMENHGKLASVKAVFKISGTE